MLTTPREPHLPRLWTALTSESLFSYSYTLLHFHNSTHMTYEARASADNSVLDTVTLYKEHGAGW